MASIEPKYLDILRNPITNTITADVSTILTHIFRYYGFITPEVLANNSKQVKDMQYTVAEPLVIVSNAVEELKLMAEAASNPFTEEQLISIATQIIKNTHDFEDGPKSWYNLPPLGRTWDILKTHF